MKNKAYIILLIIVILVFSWSCKRESESHFAIDMEEVRLIKACTTDSVSLQAVLHLDSIEGYDHPIEFFRKLNRIFFCFFFSLYFLGFPKILAHPILIGFFCFCQ